MENMAQDTDYEDMPEMTYDEEIIIDEIKREEMSEEEEEKDKQAILCCLCNTDTDERPKVFTDQYLNRCKESFNIRKYCKVRLSPTVCLPDNVDNVSSYHSTCYKRFTAINKKYREVYQNRREAQSAGITEEEPDEQNMPQPDDNRQEDNIPQDEQNMPQPDDNRQEDNIPQPLDEASEVKVKENDEGSTGKYINKRNCCICHRYGLRYGLRVQYPSVTKKYATLQCVVDYATLVDHVEFIEHYETAKQNKECMYYHQYCKRNYINNFRYTLPQKESVWHKKREARKIAFHKLCVFIKDNIIEEKNAYLVKFLQDIYHDFAKKCYVDAGLDLNVHFYLPNMKEKILRVHSFSKKLRVIDVESQLVFAPYETTKIKYNIEELMERELFDRAALKIRSIIKNMKVTKLPHDIRASNLIRGECEDVPKVVNFFTKILQGHNSERKKNPTAVSRSRILSSDLVFSVHHGRVMTPKHISLAMTLKSMSNSKELITLVNRLGHCINYDKLLELETRAAITSTLHRSSLCPENIALRPDLHVGVSFDNYDRFVETLDGKYTLNYTQGIVYQDDCGQNEAVQQCVPKNETNAATQKKRRRSSEEVEENPKRLRLQVSNVDIPSKLEIYQKYDIAWVISLALNIQTPMWVGFNAQLCNDSSTGQIVSYLPPLNDSPTNNQAVMEFLRRCVKVADECGQNYIQVTNDLAISKIVFKILSTEREGKEWHIYKRIFPHMGMFHTEISLFKLLGTYIADCGFTNVMVDSNVLAGGSVAGFLTATNFNRAKKLHILACATLSKLHFEFFLDKESIQISDDVKRYAKLIQIDGLIDENINDEEFCDLINKYINFKSQTEAGEHGKTPQFYINYVKFVNYYMMLERSIRMGDFELFLYILPIINNLYFSFNYYNYARWLPYYHQLLTNVETTHPGLLSELKGGRFGIRRTQKSFARQPIDLVLDQMVNRDAGRTMSGITYLTNSASARMRWSTDRCIISAVTNNLFNMVGLNKSNDITNDLSNSRKKKNLEGINNLSTAINNRMNPFDESLDKDWLFNISTGKAAPREVSDYLLSVERIGKEKKEKFITDCSDDVTQFDVLPIKHVAVKNFTSAIKKKRIVIKTTVEVLNAQTNMFGQLLRIALDTKNVDMEKVLTFPLFEVPLSLCHSDGTIHKTDKSVLTKQLELSLEEHLPPPTTDIKLFDGFAILHSMTDVPQQFGDISKSFLRIICNSPANEIHVIFDTYKSPSIKNTEHERRDAYSIQYHQMRPDNFERELRNSYFKTNLVQFLICHWGTNDVKEIIGDKTVYINHELCFKIKVEEGNVTTTMCDELTCASHEEANTKIVYHICKIQKENANVVVRCSDTDLLIIMLANVCHCATTLNIWMDFGSGNNRRFINISGIHDSIGDEACRGLAGLHAFTGCNVTPSFYRKGKTKPLKMYLNNKDFQLAFTNMAVDQENSFSIIERFTCSMYGLKNASSVNECRFFMFLKATENKNRDAVLDCASNLDAYLFPPSQSELRQQFLRASYVNSIWSNAHQKNPTLLTPEGNGWILENGNYAFQWFIGDMAPADIAEIIVEEDDVNDGEVANNIDTEDDEDESLKLPSNVFDDDDGDESDNSSYDIDSDFQMEVE